MQFPQRAILLANNTLGAASRNSGSKEALFQQNFQLIWEKKDICTVTSLGGLLLEYWANFTLIVSIFAMKFLAEF